MKYLQSAFEAACKDARAPEEWHVCLMEDAPFYGGPEEGGWWGTDTVVVAYKTFPTEAQAKAALASVETLARELEADSRKNFGEQCLREMEWLDARGLDADWLPEPDGESHFHVIACQEIPSNRRGCRQYS